MKRESTGTRLADSDRELLAHLERLTGRRINSPQDISDYVSEPLANGSLGPFLNG